MSVQLGFNNLKYNNISSPENKNIGFQGLNRHLSKHFVEGQEAALKAINKYPKSRRFVGNLPPEWIDKIPKENRRETVQQIQDLFAGFAEKVYSSQIANVREYEKFVADYSNQLKQILKLDTNIEFIDFGGVGKAYKLKVGIKQYVFKAFHSDLGDVFSGSSGKLIEPARAPYAKRNGRKSFVDFYFGKIGTKESADSFMLTKFESTKQEFLPQEEIKRLLNFLKSPVSSSDIDVSEIHNVPDSLNTIGLKIIDFGEMEHLTKKLNKTLKKFTKHFGNFYFNTKKNLDNIKAVLNEIDYIEKDFDHFRIDEVIQLNFTNVLERLKEFTKKLT